MAYTKEMSCICPTPAVLVEVRRALRQIDALDPEGQIDACSRDALAGIVLRMGDLARNALTRLDAAVGGEVDDD